MKRYSFQLLQYAPNLVSGEHFNLGVFLFDAAGLLLDARFASDFRRLRCNPLVDLVYLEALRNEFEERRLLGEGFSLYAAEIQKNLSATLRISDAKPFWGREPAMEIDRLYQAYVATPSRREIEGEELDLAPGTRRALRKRMDQAFRRYHLLGNGGRLRGDVSVSYGGPRLRFTFDYGYQPNGAVKYVHGLALRNDVNDASRLCFVLERLRAQSQTEIALTAVLDDQVPGDTRDLLGSSGIQTWEASRLGELALAIRAELGL